MKIGLFISHRCLKDCYYYLFWTEWTLALALWNCTQDSQQLRTYIPEILYIYFIHTCASIVFKCFPRVTFLPLSWSWMLTRALRRCWRHMRSSRWHFWIFNFKLRGCWKSMRSSRWHFSMIICLLSLHTLHSLHIPMNVSYSVHF